MEAGFSRMNDLTVIQASQGLAEYILSTSTDKAIVLGNDHRHNSQRFARLTAAAMISRGIKACCTPDSGLSMTR
jgi:phosphoglucomutase